MTSTDQSHDQENDAVPSAKRQEAGGLPRVPAQQLGYKRWPGFPDQGPREGDGYRVFGGVILYGGIGWLIGHFTGLSFLFPIGMLLGLALSVCLIIFRVRKT